MTQLILKRAPLGDNLEDYDVLEDGGIVGRIYRQPAPRSRRAGCGSKLDGSLMPDRSRDPGPRQGREPHQAAATSAQAAESLSE